MRHSVRAYAVTLVGIGAFAVSAETGGGGVAYMAHIGGFLAGVVAGLIFRGIRPRRPPAARMAWG
jgi:membrane associated rhomboid family serine protease